MTLSFAVHLAIFPSSATSEYRGELILLDVAESHEDDGDYDPGHTEFKLLANYTYVDPIYGEITVPQGTVVNGASIPKEAWDIIGGPWSGRYRNASVIHDYLCEIYAYDSETVHRIFYNAMKADEVPFFKRNLMYYSVLMFGPTWESGSNFEPGQDTPRRPVDRIDLIEFDNMYRNLDLTADQIENIVNKKLEDKL